MVEGRCGVDHRQETLIQRRAKDEADALAKDPNIIYDDTICKYTINLPLSLYAKIQKRAKARYGGRKSMWIREVLERELANDAPVSFKQLIAEVEQRKAKQHTLVEDVEFHRMMLMAWVRRKFGKKIDRHLDPPKRYLGLTDGLQSNTSKAIRYKIHQAKMLDNACNI